MASVRPLRDTAPPRQEEGLVLLLARILAPHVARELAAHAAAGDGNPPGRWYDQRSSPLGRRAHNEACRSGRLAARKVGRRWLARAEDVEAYIEKHGATPAATAKDEHGLEPAELLGAEASPFDAAVDAELREAGFTRIARPRPAQVARGAR